MKAEALHLARMGPEHLGGAVALSQAEGWPHRVDDWALVLSRSQGVVALEGQRVVATAMATPFGPVGTMNMIVVEESQRGRGLGRRIMEQAMARISPMEWRLVATQEGLPLYRKLGFRPCGEVRQHQGIARAARGGLPEVWAEETDAPVLAALDRAATGMDRTWLIDALLRHGRVLIHRERGEIVAFAGLRLFGRGEVAGPVVARTEEEARALLATLLTYCAGRFLRADVPEEAGLHPFLASCGIAPTGGGVSMRRGVPSPTSSLLRSFALASQALG